MANADSHGQPPGDETRAFQAFYGNRDEDVVEEPPRGGLWYRVFVAWWRDRV